MVRPDFTLLKAPRMTPRTQSAKTSQFSHPSKGINPTHITTAASTPIRTETTFTTRAV